MAVYTSNVNRVTGLSGIDTESMIDKMMKAESAKYERLQRKKTSLTWQQETFRKLISSMDSFKNKWFGSNLSNNIGYDSFWNTYKTSVVDANTGKESNTVTINSTTNSGKYEIEVLQKAQTESFRGDSISTNVSATAREMEYTINNYGDVSLNFNLDGVTKEIKVTKQELSEGGSLENVLNEKLKSAFGTTTTGEAKIAVSKDGEKLVFKPNGQGHSLAISDGSARTEGVSFKSNKDLTTASSFEITIDGFTAKVNFTEEDDNEDKKFAKIQEALTKAKKEGSDETKDLNAYISISKDSDNKLVISNRSKNSELNVNIKINGEGQSQKLNPTGSADLIGMSSSTNNVKLGSKLTNVFGEEIFKDSDEITLNFGGKDVIINKNDTIQSFVNKVNSSGAQVKMEFNEVTNRFTLKSAQSGANGNINIGDEKTNSFLKDTLKINMNRGPENEGYTAGQDAIFKVDGVETTRPSNDVSMNGINFTINGTGKVTIGAENDVDGMVKKIKEFVEDYNKLIDEFNKEVMQNRPKSDKYSYYEPLTDDERKSMSEDEIKKYEEQAKKGLLYRDENINKFLSSLRDNIYKSVDIGGKSISLYEIGITTTKNYNDGGKLEIDEEKLKKALQERGDEVKQLFTNENGIAASIKKDMEDAIGGKGYLRQRAGIEGTTSAANNQLSEELRDISERMAAEKERLYKKENYYFNLFAKMEAAMNKQNSQMSILLSSMGGQ